MKLILIPFLAVTMSCSGVEANRVESLPAARLELTEARRLLDAGQLDEALLVTDRLLKADPRHRDAHLLAADANMALLESGRTGQQFFLLDAITHLERATELDTHDATTWLRLADARLKNSDFEGGVEAGEHALAELERTGADDKRKAKAALAIADNRMQVFVDARRVEIEAETRRPERETMELANATLAGYEVARSLGAVGPATLGTARVYQWIGREAQALEAIERGILQDPSNWDLHELFRGIYDRTGNPRACVGAYRRLLRTHKDNPGLLFYAARAQLALGDQFREKSEWDQAITEYERAAEIFAKCGELQPDFESNCEKNQALCVLSVGRVEYERGNLDAALEHTERAHDTSTAVANYDAQLRPELYHTLNGNYLGNLCMIGTARINDDGLAAGLEHYERVLARHPEQFGATIYNNAALCARDLGVEVAESETGERAERLAAAMELWEKSYAYYCEAVKRQPDDPRIVNDCGLMLVYHLHRDYDKARAMFDRAIELGQPQLDALGEDAPGSRRQFLEEAVGDAWQNIGVLLEQLNKPASEIAPFYERAVTYYPNRRRAAAQWLAQRETQRNAPREATSTTQDPRKKTFDARIREAAAKADEQDYDSALLVMDNMAKEMKGYAPFHYHFGLYSLRYGQAAQRDGGDAGLIGGLYADAVSQLSEAMKLDGKDGDVRVALAEACLATGEFGKALEAVDELPGDTANTEAGAAIRAKAAGRAYVAAKGESRDDANALRTARDAFRALEKLRALTTDERNLWVNVERWDGKSKNAIDILLRAAKQNPDDQATLNDLVTVGAQVQETKRVVEFLDPREDALGRWYAGRARFDLARHEWSGSDTKAARKTLADAVAAFDASAIANPEYQNSSEQWAAFCIGMRGLIEIADEEFDVAGNSLIEALRRHPGALTSDLGSSTIKQGILIVGDKKFRARRLGDVADFYIEVGKIVPNDTDLANNEGLFCRDHGDAVSRAGDAKQAEPYYEASYAAYTRAQTADPENVRLRNDRALILVHHLGRELDTARELLETGIEDGEQMLEDSPPDDAGELQNLQEAVGDCYENLGLYWIRYGKDPAKARAALEKSFDYYPGQRRGGARRHLRTLEREGGK